MNQVAMLWMQTMFQHHISHMSTHVTRLAGVTSVGREGLIPTLTSLMRLQEGNFLPIATWRWYLSRISLCPLINRLSLAL